MNISIHKPEINLRWCYRRARRIAKNIAQHAFQQLGVGIVSYKRLNELRLKEKESWGSDTEFLLSIPSTHTREVLKYFKQARSQIRQDLFVLSELSFKRGGFFVEFGAADGVVLSNTYLLEKEFGWTGILAEPARIWQKGLLKNRAVSVESKCVWTTSGSVLRFNETEFAEISTIDAFSASDSFREVRQAGRSYEVETISLNDLLKKHNAPQIIDYLSIDTEGSEFEILSSFDFSKYAFSVITCEHNHTPMRGEIYDLLLSHGYRRKYEHLSQFEDWYIRA